MNTPPIIRFSRTVLQKWPLQIILLVICVGLSGVFEGLGFALFIPLVRFLMPQSAAMGEASYPWLEKMIQFLQLNRSFAFLLLFIIAVFALKNGCLFFYRTFSSKISVDFAKNIKKQIISSVYASDWQFFLKQKVGEITNAIGSNARMAADAFLLISLFFSEVIHIVVYCLIGLWMSWQTFLVSIVMGLLCVLSMRGIVHRSRATGMKSIDLNNFCQRHALDDLLGLKFLKGNRLEPEKRKKFNALLDDLAQNDFKSLKYGALVETLPDVVTACMLCLILWASQRYFKTPGESILVLMAILYRLNRRLMSLQTLRQRLMIYLPAYEFCDHLISSNETHREVTGNLPFERLHADIQLKNISFSYGPTAVLKGVDLVIPRNQLVALVGKSGSGKTTILDLITGLLKTPHGELLLNDHALSGYDIFSWRQKISYVPQDPYIMSGTLYENLTLGLTNCSMDKVRTVCKMVHVDQFVDRLPNGYQSEIGERGNQLSGGQKQRIALARALLREPQLLILDEATSSLDAESEQIIHDTIHSLKGTLTMLLVAHRSKLIDLADVIHVMHAGKIVDSGTKEYLHTHSSHFNQISART